MWERSLGGKDPLEEDIATSPVFLPEKFHRWRSLVGYSPWGHKELDTTERPSTTRFHMWDYPDRNIDFSYYSFVPISSEVSPIVD